MKIDLKKVMFHALTNVNEDVSYYGEIYLEKNERWIMKKPIAFTWNLLKIRMHYRNRKQTKRLRLKGMGLVDMRRIYYRHQSSVIARSLMRYQKMIADIWGSLLVPLLEEDFLYEVVEKKLEVTGFAKIRKKYQNNQIPITEIYSKISAELHVQLTPDLELMLVKKTVQTNAYIKEVFEALSTAQIPIIGVIQSCYPKELFLEILQEIYERSEGKEIVFLGSSNHSLVTLFQTFYGNAQVVEWSYLAADMPKDEEGWWNVFEYMPSLCGLTGDALGEALGFQAPSYSLERGKREFISSWIQNREHEVSREELERGISHYLSSYFDDRNREKELFLVDITEGGMGWQNFQKKFYELYPDDKVTHISLADLLWEEENQPEDMEDWKEILYRFDSILQMDAPILVRILEQEISYVQPTVLPRGKKELFQKILEEFVRTMKPFLEEDLGIPNISGKEMSDLLYAGKDELIQLKRRMMGS